MKIYYIMGKSSSGKDTIFKLLLEDKDLNLKRLVPWTTRPIRFGESPGKDYNFVSNEKFYEIQAKRRFRETKLL